MDALPTTALQTRPSGEVTPEIGIAARISLPETAPAQSIPEVLAAMDRIGAILPPSDGVACFNRLYRQVTRAVADAVAAGGFADPQSLSRLDVLFANLFFEALTAYAREPERTPPAWQPLFTCRSRTAIGALRFTVAGMNAHINRDLAVALVKLWEELGGRPDKDSAQYRDFQQVNQILGKLEQELKGSFLTGAEVVVDPALHGMDDAVAMWSITEERTAAWDSAEMLWTLRSSSIASDSYIRLLDRMVCATNRGLLFIPGMQMT